MKEFDGRHVAHYGWVDPRGGFLTVRATPGMLLVFRFYYMGDHSEAVIEHVRRHDGTVLGAANTRSLAKWAFVESEADDPDPGTGVSP